MRLQGTPIHLTSVAARTATNARFAGFELGSLDRVFLPDPMRALTDEPALGVQEFLEDDNRGAVTAEPVATLDGLGFHLSLKGIGSCVDPFSSRPLDRGQAAQLTDDPDVRTRLLRSSALQEDRIITGELWLRGSPYGGQGENHALTALRVSERADLTSIQGFLIAPVVKVAYLPPDLEERVRTLHWYRRFRGRIVQELRLVPSNIRVYFHARNTVGNNIDHLFDLFGIRTDGAALQFELEFVRTAVPLLTLFARTLREEKAKDRFFGLDFHDVWLDKDAVLAPTGAVYFVDLEGIEETAVDREGVKEKIEDQVYRALYEFMFAYETIDRERRRRFGDLGTRKGHFATMLREALRHDPFVRPVEHAGELELLIRNRCSEESLYTRFPMVDR